MSNMSTNLFEQFDEGFITPQRKPKYKKPSVPRFFSSKMKAIADNIHKNTFSKFRIHSLEEGGTKVFAYSELKQISETSKSRSLTKICSIPKIQQMSRKTKARLYGRQSKSSSLRQLCLQKIEELNHCETMKRSRREQFKHRQKQNQELAQQLASLQQKKSFLEKIKDTINMYNINSIRLKEVCQLFNKKADQSERKLIIIQIQKEKIKCLQKELQLLEQKVKRIETQYIRSCEETIQSLFYTGMLMEQLFVASCGRVDKRSGTLAKIQSRLYDRLHRREIILDQAEQFMNVRIFLTIYMHTKSVSLNNIAVLMDSLSFFSDQFRQLYSFQAFRKYAYIFIERCLTNMHQQNNSLLLSNSVERQKPIEEDQQVKIIISAPRALEIIMKNVLEIFRVNSRQFYTVSEGCKTNLKFHISDIAGESPSEWRLRFDYLKLIQM